MRECKPGIWELRLYCGRDPVTAKHVAISRTVHGGKRHAERQLATLLQGIESAWDKGISTAAPRSVTVSQLMAKHLETFKGSPTTLRSYKLTVELYIDTTIGRHTIMKVGPMLLDQLYTYLSKERGLGDPTIHKVHAVLRGGFAKAVKWGWLE